MQRRTACTTKLGNKDTDTGTVPERSHLMAALTFFAYFFLGCGPGIAFFLVFLAHKSFVSLLVLFR